MVVDNEHDLLAVMKAMLESKGYEVHTFADPVKALTHAKDCKECGIVISDVRMPVMNGFQLARALKKSRPDIRVVFMSAFEINTREWQQVLPSTRIDQFLTKPFDAVKLVEAIEKCVPLVR